MEVSPVYFEINFVGVFLGGMVVENLIPCK